MEDVESAVAAVKETGSDALAVTTDVAEEESVEALFEAVDESFGRLDVIVNTAGINPAAALGKPKDVSIEAFDTAIDVNLRGAFLCSKLGGERLLESGGGSVINVASVSGLVGLPRQHPYVSSKHGLVGLTKSLALDWAPDVRVNALAPGYVVTDLTEPVLENDDLYSSIIDRTPIERFADPEEIAGPAVFLASDLASFVTGSCLVVDGGWTTR
jgi:NAD(P)-dependent dehydrogenase (short-subunit alcohol dehydrogenase family)